MIHDLVPGDIHTVSAWFERRRGLSTDRFAAVTLPFVALTPPDRKHWFSHGTVLVVVGGRVALVLTFGHFRFSSSHRYLFFSSNASSVVQCVL